MDTLNPSAFPSDFSISPAQFNALLGRSTAPLVLDVRRDARFAESPRLLAGAVRCAPEDVAALIASSRPRSVAVYCVYGHNVSEDAVAELRAAGWNAVRIAGGIEGGEPGVDAAGVVAQWRTQAPLSFAKRPDWGVTGEKASRWITREHPKIDRIACPWLIRRFIDPRAEFFYVPTAQVFVEAARLQAVAYDIPGAPVSHEGERCSFDALVKGLSCAARRWTCWPPSRSADTDRPRPGTPIGGLLALGLAARQDDLAMLEVAMPMYDALYAWCCDRVRAQDEPHSWRPETMVGANE